MDNHLTGNPVLSVIDLSAGPPPPGVWSLVYEVRDIVDRAIEDHAPPSWSFVFTTVLTNEGDRDTASVDRLRRLAHARRGRYVPVVLSCDVDELARRATAAGRAERQKLADPAAVAAYARARTLHRPDGSTDLDVTTLPATEAAAQILDVAGLT